MNKTTFRVFKQLSASCYIGGTTIGKRLSITRSVVWKCIQQLQHDYYVPIKSSAAKGYKLVHTLPLINIDAVQEILFNQSCEIDYLLSVNSTNAYLQEKQLSKSYHICIAEHQKLGKGRFNRLWQSPFAQNIYCSIKTVLEKDVSELSGLSLAIAVIVAKSLSYCFQDLKVQLKWPNDVYISAKKVSGNIVEVKAESNFDSQVIIGIGINVNMLTEETIDQKWSSIALELDNQIVDRTLLLKDLLKRLLSGLKNFEKNGFSDFLKNFVEFDFLNEKDILLTLPNNDVLLGRYDGVSELGQLKLDINGSIKLFASGEASINKKSSC